MLTLISVLLTIIAVIGIISFLITFFYTAYIIIAKNENNLFTMIAENKNYGLLLFVTFISFGLIFILSSVETNLFRKKIIHNLQSLNENQITLVINNHNIENDSIKLKLINTEKPSSGRKTGMPEIKISLMNAKDRNDFLLKRDFGNKKKYWVEYKLTENEYKLIGQIITNQLDYIK